MCDEIKSGVVSMKAVIVDIKGKYAVVLDKQGGFKKIRNSGQLRVGYEIELPQQTLLNFNKVTKIASIAAVFVGILGLSIGIYSYSLPYSYVNVDINPSIEITTNIYDRIIGVEGLNEDGKKLVKVDSYMNKSLKDGVEQVLETAVKEGYIKQDSLNAVIFTVSSKNEIKVEGIQKSLESTASQKLEAEGAETEVLIEKVDTEKRVKTESQGISPGKLNLINKLAEVDSEVKVEDFKDKPVKEIMRLIKESRKEWDDGKSIGEYEAKKDDKHHMRYFIVKPNNNGQSGANNKDKDNKDKDNKDNKGKDNKDNNKDKDKGIGKAKSKDKKDAWKSNESKPTDAKNNNKKVGKDNSNKNGKQQEGKKDKDRGSKNKSKSR
jgi:hypothetical protein